MCSPEPKLELLQKTLLNHYASLDMGEVINNGFSEFLDDNLIE